MTQEIKDRLEQAAINYTDDNFELAVCNDKLEKAFKAGAQTILENPGEWGLWKQDYVVKHVNEVAVEASKVGRELEAALNRIIQGNCSPTMVAKPALNGTSCYTK